MKNNFLRTLLIILAIVIGLSSSFLAGGLGASLWRNNPLRAAMGYDQPAACVTVEGETVVCECPACETSVCPALPVGQDAQNCLEYTSASTPSELKSLFDPFWESWELLHENFVDQPLDDTTLMRGAIQGMLAATGDKHTSYMDPDQFAAANADMEGEYTGIGAWIDITGDYVEVISPMKGSPAEEAGLKANDIVIGVNGQDMTGLPGDLVQKQILGPAGEEVTLTVRRGAETLDITITRRVIHVPVVDYEMLEGEIAYIALHTFNEQSTSQLRAALDDLLSQNPKGLVFDLRDNGGGFLVTAIEVASEFLQTDVVMYEEYGDGSQQAYEVMPGGRGTTIPMVVLINAGSASASEIVAGAIQDTGRAELVGVTSYGKGSVQNWISLRTEDGGVRITIARWLTPNGTQISGAGLTPDVVVEMTDEDYAEGRDPQLDAAVDLLLGN